MTLRWLDAATIVRWKLARFIQAVQDSPVVLWTYDIEWQRWVATGGAAAAVVMMVVGSIPTILVIAYPHVAGESRWGDLQTLDECVQSPMVFGAGGEWLGRVPASLMDESDHCRELRQAGWREHTTDYLKNPPEKWWAMLVAAEDRKLGTRSSVNCVDLAALYRVGLNVLTGRLDRGGSSIAMQVSRSLRGTAPSADERLLDKIPRKLTELADATVICRKLGGAHAPELRRWAARHLPCVHGTKSSKLGGSIYGLDACSRILFGKAPEELDLAELAILVAANWRHVLLAPSDKPGEQQLARRRWGQIKKRALLVVVLTYKSESPAVKEVKARLASMDLPPVPAVAPDLAALLPGDPAERIAVAANPEKRVTHFARGEITQAMGELRDVYGEAPRNLIGIELTLDLARNAKFKRTVEKRLDEIELRRQLQLDLPPADGSTTSAADVTLSLVDDDGRVIRHYSAGYYRVWSGSNAKRDADGRYQPDREDRAIGSIAKMVAAPLIGARFDASGTLCNARLGGLRNSDGSQGFQRCQAPAAQVKARRAFAKSWNLPIAWALKPVAPQRIEALVAGAGLRLLHGVEPRVAVAFGMVAGGPRAQHRLAAALNRGARGRPAWAIQPTLIKTLYFRDEDGGVQTVAFDDVRDRGRIDLSEWFENKRVGPFVANVLGAPAQRGGTLAGLDRIVRNSQSSHLIAKSGTVTTSDSRIRDQIVLGSFVNRAGDQNTFQMLIGAPDPRSPLAGHGGIPVTDRLGLIEALLGG